MIEESECPPCPKCREAPAVIEHMRKIRGESGFVYVGAALQCPSCGLHGDLLGLADICPENMVAKWLEVAD